MCAPAAIAAGIGSVISAGVTIGSGVVAGEAKQLEADQLAQQAEDEAEAAAKQAEIRRIQAADALQQGTTEAADYAAMGREVGASAEATVSKMGLADGAAYAARARYMADVDAARAKADAARAAWGYVIEADTAQKASESYKIRAEDERRAGYLGRVGIALQTGGAVVNDAANIVKAVAA